MTLKCGVEMRLVTDVKLQGEGRSAESIDQRTQASVASHVHYAPGLEHQQFGRLRC